MGLDCGVPVGGPELGLPAVGCHRGLLKAGVCHDQIHILETK